MKTGNSLKISLHSALVGILLYAVYLPVRHIPFIKEFLWSKPNLGELVDHGNAMMLLLSIIVCCVAIFVHRKQLPAPDKQHRILAHVAAWSTLTIVLFPSFHGVWIFGTPLLYINWWLLEVMTLLAAAVVWKYSALPLGEDSLPKSLSTLVLLAAILSMVVLLLMIVAGCYVICTGHVIGGGIGTFCYFSWIRAFVPAIIFTCYVIHITPEEKLSKIREYIYRTFVWIGFLAALCAIAYYIIDRITFLY